MAENFLPDSGTPTFATQSRPCSLDYDVMNAGYARLGVADGCAVTASGAADNKVNVAAGHVIVNGNYVSVTAAAVTLTAPDATNPRVDLITVSTAGALAKTDGTPAANPVPPDLPANVTVLAAVTSPAAGGNTVAAGWIRDKRINLLNQEYSCVLQSAFTITAAANTLQDITGLAIPVLANKMYHFKFMGLFTTGASTTGSRWSVNFATGASLLTYVSEYQLTATTMTSNPVLTAVQLPAASNLTSNVSNGGANRVLIEGMFLCTATDTFQIQGAREVSTDNTVQLRAGSVLYWRQLT